MSRVLSSIIVDAVRQHAFTRMPSQEAYREKSPAEYVEEEEQRGRKEAFTYLVESGRAANRERAEQYLDSLNRIKEKLIHFSRDQVLRQSLNAKVGVGEPAIEYGEKDATQSELDEILPENIDRINPELWKLEKHVESAYTKYLRMTKKAWCERDYDERSVTDSFAESGCGRNSPGDYLSGSSNGSQIARISD